MKRNTDERKLEIEGKRALVVGLGISGMSMAVWLREQGAHVIATDIKDVDQLDQVQVKHLSSMGIRLEAGAHRVETFLEADMIVLSPGVSPELKPVEMARQKGVSVLGELELASRFIDAPIIAVTGTNGKSTTTELISFMLKKANFKVFTGGNIGKPLTECLINDYEVDYVVLEVSSFQLETIEKFKPYLSIILNISPDHLDRHGDIQSYAEVKFRIFMNQEQGSYLILNYDYEILRRARIKDGLNTLWFSKKRSEHLNAWSDENGSIYIKAPGSSIWKIDPSDISMPGPHNVENIMASALTSMLMGVEPKLIREAVLQFKGLPHRLQLVGSIDGVDFFNDSKATNLDSACKSIMAFSRPIILIAGGRHKGASYKPLAEVSKGRVKFAIFIGESRHMIAKEFDGFIPFVFAETMDDAIRRAFSMAQTGDVVLLAPACSSFDMFRDYEHRGEVFESLVRKLSYEKSQTKVPGL